jgi:predicted esterase
MAGTSVGWIANPGEPPSIMFHGTADTTVTFSHAQALCDNLNGKAILCEMNAYAGLGHDIGPKTEDTMERSSHFVYEQVLEPLGYTTNV